MRSKTFDSALQLRDGAAAAVAATTAETAIAIPLPNLSVPRGVDPKKTSQCLKAIINVTSHDRTDGDEITTFTLEACTSAAGAGAVTVATTLGIIAVGQLELAVSMEEIRQKLPTATHIRIKATVAGASPVGTKYGAYLDACCC